MTFYTFMTRKYEKSNSPEGDLARDMKRDRVRFPRNRSCKLDGWHGLIRGHLERSGACFECLDIFEKCWKEYVKHEKTRQSKPRRGG